MQTQRMVLDDKEEKRIQQMMFHDRVKILHDHLLTTTIPATFLCAVVLAIGLYRPDEAFLITIWLAVVILISFLRLFLLRFYRHSPENDQMHLDLFLLGSTLAALSWGVATTLMMHRNDVGDLILTIVIIVGITAGGSQTLQASRLANMSFMVITILPLFVWLILQEDRAFVVLSFAVLGYLGFMLKLAQDGYTQFNESIRLRHINELLAKQFSNINSNLRKEIEERERTQQQLDYLAMHDALTTVANRHSFDSQFNVTMLRSLRADKKFIVLFIDIDHFKLINDQYGHEAGDVVLYQVANRLKKHLRTNDTIARMGGDEFIVLLEGVDNETILNEFLERIHHVFDLPIQVEGNEIAITLSIGVSVYPNDGENKNMLLKKADIALYEAKKQGRNRIQFYDATLI